MMSCDAIGVGTCTAIMSCDHMMSYDTVGVGTEEWYDTQPPWHYVWHDKQS